MKRQIFAMTILSLAVFIFPEYSLMGWDVIPPRSSITQETWEAVYPYLLPETDELKFQLDEIFSQYRVTLNSETLSESGFTNVKPRKYSRIVVTKHPKVPGFVFKIYLDDQGTKSDDIALYFLIRRVQGALTIQNYIDEHDLHENFKVPKKWLYLLPDTPMSKKKYSYKNFIVVEEDMYIMDKESNKKTWKSSKVTEKTLLGLYRILKDIGLMDCTRIENIPFSEDGKITFIDTEMFGYYDVPLKRIKKVLSPNMRSFWSRLIH
jgi:hypothetical protein